MSRAPDEETRPDGIGAGPEGITSTSTPSVAPTVDIRLRPARPVVPFVARGVQQDSDARLAGELAAARIAVLEPMTYSEKCWDCAALGIRELQLLGWDRKLGWRMATCPHVLVEAS